VIKPERLGIGWSNEPMDAGKVDVITNGLSSKGRMR